MVNRKFTLIFKLNIFKGKFSCSEEWQKQCQWKLSVSCITLQLSMMFFLCTQQHPGVIEHKSIKTNTVTLIKTLREHISNVNLPTKPYKCNMVCVVLCAVNSYLLWPTIKLASNKGCFWCVRVWFQSCMSPKTIQTNYLFYSIRAQPFIQFIRWVDDRCRHGENNTNSETI